MREPLWLPGWYPVRGNGGIASVGVIRVLQTPEWGSGAQVGRVRKDARADGKAVEGSFTGDQVVLSPDVRRKR